MANIVGSKRSPQGLKLHTANVMPLFIGKSDALPEASYVFI